MSFLCVSLGLAFCVFFVSFDHFIPMLLCCIGW